MTGQGPAGITWRRELSAKLIAALVILGLIALGGLTSGEGAGTAIGLLAVAGGVLILYFRRPATVTVGFTAQDDGSELTVSGGPDAEKVAQIVRTVAARSPSVASVGLP